MVGNIVNANTKFQRIQHSLTSIFFLSLIFLDKFSIANYDARSGKMGAAPVSDSATHERRRCPHVGVVSGFFYFLFFYGFELTQLQFALISAELGRFGQNQIVTADQNGRNKPKSALNHVETDF